MAHESMRACRIEQVGKQRNGRPRFWCTVHKGSATGRLGIRLDQCELAYRTAERHNVFELDFADWPGGVALWGAVAPVFDTTARRPEFGIHVHARKRPGRYKDIDGTYDAVRIKTKSSLFDENEILVTGETAVNYYLSKFMNREVRNLFCIRCGELHFDAGYYAITPHRNHLCHGCGHIFRDNGKSVSNPIALLGKRPDVPNAPHALRRADKKLDIHQSEAPGGIQIWASNPALLWTTERNEEEGLHVHTFDAQGEELENDTYREVRIDGVLLNEEHVRHYMAQLALPYLKGRIRSLHCPQCRAAVFEAGYSAFELKTNHKCGNCGCEFKVSGKPRAVVSNPFVEVREDLLEGKSVSIRSKP